MLSVAAGKQPPPNKDKGPKRTSEPSGGTPTRPTQAARLIPNGAAGGSNDINVDPDLLAMIQQENATAEAAATITLPTGTCPTGVGATPAFPFGIDPQMFAQFMAFQQAISKQGETVPGKLFVHVDGMSTPGEAYVAFSRPTTLENVTILPAGVSLIPDMFVPHVPH